MCLQWETVGLSRLRSLLSTSLFTYVTQKQTAVLILLLLVSVSMEGSAVWCFSTGEQK